MSVRTSIWNNLVVAEWNFVKFYVVVVVVVDGGGGDI
jgi:hypothetical protein